MDSNHRWNTSLQPAILGFIFSLLLTYAAYRLDQVHMMTPFFTSVFILTFCVIQALLQFLFFLHLGMEESLKWNFYAFLFTTFIVLVVVSGSIWILQNLDYNLMRHR